MMNKVELNGKVYRIVPEPTTGCHGCAALDPETEYCMEVGNEGATAGSIVECGPNDIVLVEDTPEGLARYVAARFEKPTEGE
jgi:hypothetical protein